MTTPPPAPPAPFTLLRLTGRDVLAVLHRISTQSLEDLAPGEARATLFCDFRARLLHRACVARAADGTVWLARPDAPGAELAAHVDRHVFREDVKIADASEGLRAIARYGGGAGGTGGRVEWGGGRPMRLWLGRGERIEFAPADGGAAADLDERARIEAGAPRHGHEIRDDFNPFEAGLALDVHLRKGCFTGQESLMRLMTYESVRRRLVRLDLAGAAPAPRTGVLAGGARVGEVTSASGEGPAVALAVIRHEALEPGVALEIEGGGAVVGVRPFEPARPLGLPAPA